MPTKRSRKTPEFISHRLEQWPAHASGRSNALSSVRVSDNRLLFLSEKETKLTNLEPKPKFFENLDSMLKSGLQSIPETDVDGKLCVYKEVFRMLIAAFKTYAPIFNKIYDGYETALAYYKSTEGKLRIFKECIWTMDQQCDQRVLTLQKRENPKIESMRHKIAELQAAVSKRNEEKIVMEMEIEKLADMLKEEHSRYLHESDAKRLLVNELTNMRSQYNELEVLARQSKAESAKIGDPTVLRIALENAMKAQSEAEIELIKMKAEYVEVVPKMQYEALLKKSEQNEETISNQTVDGEELQRTIRQREEQIEEILRQRDEYRRSLEEANRSSTPRPNWEEVGKQLPCGLFRWQETTAGMSSQDKVRQLIEELAKYSDMDRATVFVDTQETGGAIPRFLRCDLPGIARRTVYARDCLLLTEEIWSQRKAEKDAAKVRASHGGSRPKSHPVKENSFDEFLDDFFKRIYGIPQIRLEWAYGFYDSIQRHKDYYELNEIRRVIDNEMDEACHWHLLEWLNAVQEYIINFTTESTESKPRIISLSKLKASLLSLFGDYLEANIEALMQVAFRTAPRLPDNIEDRISLDRTGMGQHGILDNSDGEVDLDDIFRQSRGGDISKFKRKLVDLYEGIKASFIEEITTELHRAYDGGFEGMQQVTASEIIHVINSVSLGPDAQQKPSKPELSKPQSQANLEAAINWVMTINPNHMPAQSISYDVLLKRLAGANLGPSIAKMRNPP